MVQYYGLNMHASAVIPAQSTPYCALTSSLKKKSQQFQDYLLGTMTV